MDGWIIIITIFTSDLFMILTLPLPLAKQLDLLLYHRVVVITFMIIIYYPLIFYSQMHTQNPLMPLPQKSFDR